MTLYARLPFYPGKLLQGLLRKCFFVCVASVLSWALVDNLSNTSAFSARVQVQETSFSGYFSEPKSTRILPVWTGRIELIIPVLVLHHESTPSHYPEILGAVGNNMMNRHIGRVHALVEGDASHTYDLCSTFARKVQQANPLKWGQLQNNMRKVICVPLDKQATYEVVLRYASALAGDRIVMVANADVAFDDSLKLIDLIYLRAKNAGVVISVAPPISHEPYQRLFGNRSGHECASKDPCHQTKYPGSGFDAIVFKTTLRAGVITNLLDFYMNRYGAENVAATVLTEQGGIKFTNPCQMVKAYHWHCSPKMHFNNEFVKAHGFLNAWPPCKQCPGLKA